MLRNLNLNWQFEDSFGNPHKLWTPYSKGFNYETFGVYIIWKHRKSKPKVIYAGKGWIKNRFYSHRNDKRITKYHSPQNPLYVVWAEVRKKYVEGTESYLINSLKPLVNRNSRRIEPIDVNLPVIFKIPIKQTHKYAQCVKTQGNIPELQNLIDDCIVARRKLRVPSKLMV